MAGEELDQAQRHKAANAQSRYLEIFQRRISQIYTVLICVNQCLTCVPVCLCIKN